MTKQYKITKIEVSTDENVTVTFLCTSDDTAPITATIEISRDSAIEDALELISNESNRHITSKLAKNAKDAAREKERADRITKANKLKQSLNVYIGKETSIEKKEKKEKK